jgi:hypothetical protein
MRRVEVVPVNTVQDQIAPALAGELGLVDLPSEVAIARARSWCL